MADKLMPGETAVMKLHRHWIVLLRSVVVPVVLVLVAIGVVYLLGARATEEVKVVIVLAAVAVAGLWLIVGWIRWAAASFMLTDQRVILSYGVFSRSTKVIGLDRVQDVSTHQNLIGRLLAYGRVEIDAAGAQGAEVLDHLPDPDGFRDHVFVQAERRRGAGQAGAATQTSPT